MDTDKRGAECVNPYDDERTKGSQVEEMFDSIAPAYDFMNTAMTMGLHRRWRHRALQAAYTPAWGNGKGIQVLDVATGTGDLAFHLKETLLPQAEITGIDLSEGMLSKARKKALNGPEGLRFIKGDALDMPFKDGSFNLVTVAYGVRNFERLEQGLREMHRVLSPGGRICIIELSEPANPTTHALYRFYTRTLIPLAGRLISGDRRAYTYLPQSIAAAPQRGNLTRLMEKAGFRNCRWKSLTFGAVTYYTGEKIE